MRSLSPSKIFVCTSTVSPIANSGTSDLRLVFSTISRICWLMVYSYSKLVLFTTTTQRARRIRTDDYASFLLYIVLVVSSWFTFCLSLLTHLTVAQQHHHQASRPADRACDLVAV